MKNNNHNISEDTVAAVANLARLSLSSEDIKLFQKQLAPILEYIAQLDEVDITGIQPTSHVLPSMKDVFREDIVHECLSNEEALENAPDKGDGFFKVPQVI
ncbi:MAG: Asp-tRNA(Asn)/Glu-tRNA(Gln) amidotransferase subunit GatC [Candidatus Omnitrophica bacterium]|nr:Asp-tRNA(Asn)/Glu-tRNA(Gln) amidotransferase subunit GatC [Candidatus Omnitrophota bacterium]